MTFALGLVIGLFFGSLVGFLTAVMCFAARRNSEPDPYEPDASPRHPSLVTRHRESP